MKFIDIKKHLNSGAFNPVYLIYGDDEEVLNIAEKNFKNIIDSAFKDFNISTFDLEECEPQKIIDACNTMPLMSPFKLVIVKDHVKDAGKEDNLSSKNSVVTKIVEYLKEPNTSTILIIKTQEGSTFYQKLKTTATLVDCNKLDTAVLKKFIVNECAKKETSINEDAILSLIEICNSNLGSIISELQKLISFCNNKQITVRDVENNCTKNLEYSVFELCEALSQKNAEKAMSIVDDMLQNPKNQQMVLPLISAHFRRLFMVATSDVSTAEKATLLGVKEYAIKKAQEQATRFSKKKLMEILKLINNSEFNIKSGNGGLIDTIYQIILYVLNN